ncbi:MAG: alkaline phosphatase family protein [Candidatus Bathyarchaeota archaeon]|nr:alkaline phosphatase family protein [Candidatus Bathyarchaeota archaeon]
MAAESFNHCLLVIWVDGLSIDYFSEDKTPFMYELSRKSLTGQYKPLFAFEGIGASIFTGVYPAKHGVWTEFLFDPEESQYKWTRPLTITNRLIDMCADNLRSFPRIIRTAAVFSIFKLTERILNLTLTPMAINIPLNRLKFFKQAISYDLIVKNSLSVPTLFDILKTNKVPYRVLSQSNMKDDKIFKEALVIQKVSLNFFQLGELDLIGHKYGPCSQELSKCLLKVDNEVKEIIESYRKRFDTDVFIFSDHGMVPISSVIDVTKEIGKQGLKDGRDFIVFLDSTIARFWPLNDAVNAILIKILANMENGRLINSEDQKEYSIPIDQKFGEIIWVANPGVLILPNYYQGYERSNGSHGYMPEAKGLWSPFIIQKKEVKPKKIKHIASPMDIFATIASLMDLPVPWPIDGKDLTKIE